MSVDRPQEQYDEHDHPERVEGERDGGAGRHVERPPEEHEEPGHPERGADESDVPAGRDAKGPTATATGMPEAAEGESTAGEQQTATADRDAEASPTSPARSSPALSDYGVEGRYVERPPEEHEEPGHPERGEDESDVPAGRDAKRPTATATGMPEAAEGEPTTGEQLTAPADRDADASPTSPGRSSPALSEFEVFGPGELQSYRSRWASIQLGFLDDPKGATEQADAVVSELLGRLGERHATLRDELNRRSDQDVDTEFMRLAVRQYRSLFKSLVDN